MKSKKYIEDVIKTESNNFNEIKSRLNDRKIRLLHGAMGVATESGELLDMLKKHIFYGKQLDIVNIIEEAGDMFWYLGVICHELNIDFESIMKTNIEKLRARYGDKFDEKKAVNRNLNTERKILEK